MNFMCNGNFQLQCSWTYKGPSWYNSTGRKIIKLIRSQSNLVFHFIGTTCHGNWALEICSKLNGVKAICAECFIREYGCFSCRNPSIVATNGQMSPDLYSEVPPYTKRCHLYIFILTTANKLTHHYFKFFTHICQTKAKYSQPKIFFFKLFIWQGIC